MPRGSVSASTRGYTVVLESNQNTLLTPTGCLRTSGLATLPGGSRGRAEREDARRAETYSEQSVIPVMIAPMQPYCRRVIRSFSTSAA